MMRIGMVCMDPGIPVFGTKGASIHLQSMARAFTALGAEVTILSPRIEGETHLPVRTIALPLPKGDRVAALRRADDALADVLAREGFDLIYERHALYTSAAMNTARRLGTPAVLEVNAPLLDEQARHRDLTDPAEAAHLTRQSLSAANHVVAVSPAVADYAKRHGASHVTVIPNAVPADRAVLPRHGHPRFTVGFLGSLRPWHDLDTLVAAMRLVQADIPARLLIVGDGAERDRLAVPLAEIGAEITGMIPHSDVPTQLARMDVGVASYSANQPFYFSPLKLYDYMAAGLPVVASDIGDLAGIVAGRGLTCSPDDPQALAAALLTLARDPARARDMGAQGRAHVMAHHTWERVAAQVLDLSGLRVPA